MASDVAEKIWHSIDVDNEDKAVSIIRQISSDQDLTKKVCHLEINKIVFGKEKHYRDSVTCFHIAAKKGLQNAIKEMIELCEELDVNMKSSQLKWTPLHYATFGGHKQMVRTLIKAGANKNASALDGRCPIHIALSKGYRKIAAYLVAKDCDVNVQDCNGNTPLHYCLDDNVLEMISWSGQQRQEMVELLLIKGAFGMIRNKAGDCPLHWAVQHGVDSDTVLMLIQSMEHISDGVDILNAEGQSPLHLAKDAQMAEVLLSCGAAVNLAASDDRTPLHLQVGNSEVVEMLLHHGCNTSAADKSGRIALHAAVMHEVPNLWTIEMLSSYSESVNAQDWNLESPLHLACQNKYGKVTVLEDHCQVVRDVKTGDDPVIEILLKHGARTDIQNRKKQTALLRALEKRLDHKANIIYLASRGACLDLADQYGRTAKTLFPKWYSMLSTVNGSEGQSLAAPTQALSTLKEEEEDAVSSSSFSHPEKFRRGSSDLVPFPIWVKNGNVRPPLQRYQDLTMDRNMCKLPAWVFEPDDASDYAECPSPDVIPFKNALPRWDIINDESVPTTSKPRTPRKVPETVSPLNSLTKQVTSLRDDVEEIKSFLEDFANEGEKKSDVQQEVVDLKGELQSMTMFLEKFTEES